MELIERHDFAQTFLENVGVIFRLSLMSSGDLARYRGRFAADKCDSEAI
jgi:hypothetical protein